MKIPWPKREDDSLFLFHDFTLSNTTPITDPHYDGAVEEYQHRIKANVGAMNRIAISDKGRDKIVAWVYAIGPLGGGLTKIGYSRNPDKRLRAIQSMSPVPVVLLWRIRGNRAVEVLLHEALAANRVYGEWFNLGKTPVATIEQAIRLNLPQWSLRSQSLMPKAFK